MVALILPSCLFFVLQQKSSLIGSNFASVLGLENFLNLFPNVKQLICTLGSSGVLITEEGRSYHFDATEANVVDKTGAGDFFAGGYLYGLQKNLSLVDSAKILPLKEFPSLSFLRILQRVSQLPTSSQPQSKGIT